MVMALRKVYYFASWADTLNDDEVCTLQSQVREEEARESDRAHKVAPVNPSPFIVPLGKQQAPVTRLGARRLSSSNDGQRRWQGPR